MKKLLLFGSVLSSSMLFSSNEISTINLPFENDNVI